MAEPPPALLTFFTRAMELSGMPSRSPTSYGCSTNRKMADCRTQQGKSVSTRSEQYRGKPQQLGLEAAHHSAYVAHFTQCTPNVLLVE
jgi:hypothetical protein